VQAIVDLLLLAIFLLQKQFGDEWEDHAPDKILALYNELENSD